MLTTFLDVDLYVPRMLADNARKRVAVSKSDDFEMMCHIVYATMECQGIPKKPVLAFKLLHTTKISPVTCLYNEDEWRDLIKAVEEVEVKTGEAAANIVISEKVSGCCHNKA